MQTPMSPPSAQVVPSLEVYHSTYKWRGWRGWYLTSGLNQLPYHISRCKSRPDEIMWAQAQMCSDAASQPAPTSESIKMLS